MELTTLYRTLAKFDLENPRPSGRPLSPERKRQVIGGNLSSCVSSACAALAVVLPQGNGSLLLLLIALGLAFSKAVEGLWRGCLRTLASSTKLHILIGLAFLGRGNALIALLPLLAFVLDWLEAASAMIAPVRAPRLSLG